MKFSEAASFCESRHMRLVEIYGENQNNFIKDLATNHPPDTSESWSFGYWIGLKRVEDIYLGNTSMSTNTWKWNAMKLNCDVDAKFTSFDSYFCDLFYLGNAGIHAYIGENGWCNALDYKKFANPLCQVFPEAPSPLGPQWHCPSGMQILAYDISIDLSYVF